MGKSARIKAERRDGGGGGGHGDGTRHSERRELPVFWIIVGLLIVAGNVAMVVTAPDDASRKRAERAASVPAYAEVVADGGSLPTWKGTGSDSAEGRLVPTIQGTMMSGARGTLTPGDGIARAYVVVAHWCPHCRDEVPRIVDWASKNKMPAGVEVVGISTAADRGQPNYPPAAWLAEEKWTFETLIDDEAGSAADALGVEGFPFLVFVDRDGKVTHRYSGEMPIDEFEQELTALGRTAA